MVFKRRKSMDETPAKAGKGDRSPQIRDLVQTVEWPDNAKFITGRFFPGVVPVGVHNYPLFKKDGSIVESKYKNQDGTPKQSTIPKVCLAFDPDTQELPDDAAKLCPYCKAGLPLYIDYWAEAIIREEVEAEPSKHKPSAEEKKTGFKDKDNDSSWTPVRAIKQTSNTYKRLAALKQLNKVPGKGGEKTPVSIDDEENGCDISMNFDSKAKGDGMYGLQKGDRVALTDEEKAYLRQDIEGAVEKAKESKDEAQRNADWYLKHSGSGSDDEEEYEPEEGDRISLTDTDDETYEGTVIESNDTRIRIETDDGPKTFKWKDIEDYGKLESKPKGKAGKKPAAKDDDDDEPRKPAGKKTKLPEEGDYVTVADEDGDDVSQGTVLSIDAKKVTLEEGDGTKRTFKLDDVTLAKSEPPAKPKAGKKPAAKDDDEKDDKYTPEEDDVVTVTDEDGDEVFSGTVTEASAKKVTVENDKGKSKSFTTSDHTFKKAEEEKPAKAGKKPAKEEKADEDDDEPAFKKGDVVIVTDEDDDEKEGTVTALSATTITIEDDEEEEHKFKLAKVTVKLKPKKAASGKAGKKPAKDDDDDDDAPPRKPAANRDFDFED